MKGGWSALLLCILASASRAALPLAALDETARQFAVECASAASLSPGTATLHVAEFEPYIQSPSLEPAQALFRDVMLKHLLEQRYFSLLEGPDAAATARYLLKGKLVESDGGLIASMTLSEPGSQRILAVGQRVVQARVILEERVREPAGVSGKKGPTVPPAADAETSHSRWWARGVVGFRGEDLAHGFGAVFQPKGGRWETGVEYLRFNHDDRRYVFAYNRSANNYFPVSAFALIKVHALRLNGSYVYPIRSISGLRGETLFRVRGFLKGGGGLEVQYIEDRTELAGEARIPRDTRYHYRVAPRFDLGFGLSLGNFLEAQVVGEYVVAPERFGFGHSIGGPGVMFQLGYRIR